jgi:hypothetical protein
VVRFASLGRDCTLSCYLRLLSLLVLVQSLSSITALAQIDPFRRDLVQFGYNAAFQGHPPLSAYFFYYRNEPNFIQTNMTLRLAIAPTYLDSELGFSHLLGPNTDLGINVAGGGYADSYEEVRGGTFLPSESFLGYGGEGGVSIYHLFNPGQQIPLNGILRGLARYSTYERDDKTAERFDVPRNRETFSVRTGLRLAGREPTIFPSLGMEVSAWYEGQLRTGTGTYGLNDREVVPNSHLIWGQALLAYTLPHLKHTFYVNATAGTSVNADRFSAYRLGALLPLVSEFPLSLPGYYYQELTAKQFALFGGNYLVPLDERERWNINVTAATAYVDYLEGLEQPGNWHTGVGTGVLFKTPSFKIMVGYGYGVDAIRSGGRGAHSVGVLMQLDLERAAHAVFNPAQPEKWQGIQRVFGWLGL